MTLPSQRPINGTEKVLDTSADLPQPGHEKGTAWNVFDGPLVFGLANGQTVGEVFDQREPTVEEIDTMLGQDGKAQALEKALTLPIRSAAYTIEPNDAPAAVVEATKDALERPTAEGGMKTPLQDVIGQMTGAFLYRRSYHELVFTRGSSDNNNLRLVYDKIGFRPAETCILLRSPKNGDLQGFKQMSYPFQVGGETVNPDVESDGYIPILNPYAFVHVHGKHRDPIRGLTDMQVPYWCWTTKQKVMFLWFTYLESQSLPKTILQATSEPAAENAARAVAALKNAGVVGIPKQWLAADPIQLGGGSASVGDQFLQALNYLDGMASQSILAGWIDLPSKASGGIGSYALSADQTDMFLEMLQGYATEMEQDITNNLIAPLVRANFPGNPAIPTFKFAKLNHDQIQPQFTLLQGLAGAANLNPAIPPEFLQQLVMEIGSEWGWDLDALQAAIERQTERVQKQAETQAAAAMSSTVAAAQVGASAARQVRANANQSGNTAAGSGAIPPAGNSNAGTRR